MKGLPRGRVSKTVPELGACISAPSEVRKGGHGVPDPAFGARGTRAHLGVKVPCGG